jgi:hypothetical protein
MHTTFHWKSKSYNGSIIISRDKKIVQQQVTVLISTTIQVNTSLPSHVPKGYAHRPSDGGQQIEIHLKEMHPKEIHLEDHRLIHLLDHSDGQDLTHACLYHHGNNNSLYNIYQN